MGLDGVGREELGRWCRSEKRLRIVSDLLLADREVDVASRHAICSAIRPEHPSAELLELQHVQAIPHIRACHRLKLGRSVKLNFRTLMPNLCVLSTNEQTDTFDKRP